MTPTEFRRTGGLMISILAATSGLIAADSIRTVSESAPEKSSGSTATRSAAATKGVIGKTKLPDPGLLDGSTLPEVKKSEHGMIGDFELPGDDNARGGKVGGTPGLPGQGGGQPPPPPAVSIPIPIAIPGLPAGGAGIPGGTGAGGLPIGGAGGAGLGVGTDPTQQGIGAGQSGGGINPASTGQGSPVGAIPAGGGQSSGGAQPGGSQPGGAQAGASVAGEGGGSPDGVQVGGLQGQGGAGTSSTTGVSSRPNAIAIGDSTMRIEPGSNPAPGGGNQQVAGPTQQHEKTGSGGKGSSSVTSGGRIEKGRAIPTGL